MQIWNLFIVCLTLSYNEDVTVVTLRWNAMTQMNRASQKMESILSRFEKKYYTFEIMFDTQLYLLWVYDGIDESILP